MHMLKCACVFVLVKQARIVLRFGGRYLGLQGALLEALDIKLQVEQIMWPHNTSPTFIME